MNDPSSFRSYESKSHAQPNTPLSLAVYAVISGLLIHYLLLHAGVVGQLATHLFWNLLVRATPARLLFKLDPAVSGRDGDADMATPVGLHAAKSAAMSRILGLGSSNFVTSFKRARAMPGIGNAFAGSRGTTPPGLGNWDNSCYQNSVIQGFASLPALWGFLEHNIETLGNTGSFSTHKALKDIIERLNDADNYGKRLWTPDDLKSMSSWQQQDAQEYFSKVVDQMDKEIGKALKGTTDDLGLKQMKEVSGDPSKWKPFKQLANLRSALYSRNTFRNPLEGLLAQRVGCMRCGFTEGLSLIPFNCLTVPLGTAYKQDIRDCLDQYTALEPIEGVECGKCTLLNAQGQMKKILSQIDEEAKSQEEGAPNQSDALRASVQKRLENVEASLEKEDFSDSTLQKKCHIPSRNRTSTTKSRQAVIARAPKSLVLHVNRSIFDELTGAQMKNYANVEFPETLDLSEWCLGTKEKTQSGEMEEMWEMDPSRSLLNLNDPSAQDSRPVYKLRAAIQHWGRHENGHYICYRKHQRPKQLLASDDEFELEGKIPQEVWYRLSDDDVSLSSEEEVLNHGGVFMLFYEVAEEAWLPEKLLASIPTSIGNPGVTLVDSVDGPSVTDSNLHSKEIEELLSEAKLEDRADSPQTVIEMRVDQPVTAAAAQVADEVEPGEFTGKPASLDLVSSTPSSTRSSSPTPPQQVSPPTSPSHPRTMTPIMRTSTLPSKKAGRRYDDASPSMVSAV